MAKTKLKAQPTTWKSDKRHFLPAIIMNGAFSSERLFRVETLDDEPASGLADAQYVYDSQWQQAPKGTNAGYVECRFKASLPRESALVETPDGSHIIVPSSSLIAREVCAQ